MPFSPWIEIDRGALRHNLEVVRGHAPHARVMAVIKANAYGHGVLPVAAALDSADAFAVARIEEAAQLREAGIDKRLLVLAGVHDSEELALAAKLGVELVVHHRMQLTLLKQAGLALPVAIWLKIDTGMNRLGFAPADTHELLKHIGGLSSVATVAGVLTHLANADDPGDDFTERQLRRFSKATADIDLPLSIANSAGIMGWPSSHADWVRPGIMLYGAAPFSGPAHELRPAMTFGSRLISVKMVQKGEPVGYGGIWQASETGPVGVVAAGYGDGYPRAVPSGMPVLVNGQRVPVVGRVSMDTLMVDLRSQPEANVGDEVILWGKGLSADVIAEAAQTIPYTLFCGITGRVERRIR